MELSATLDNKPGNSFSLPKGWLLFSFAYLVVLNISARFIFSFYPNTGDEAAVLFQSKVFSLLRLYGEAPPAPALFSGHYTAIFAQKWFGLYPPIYPLLLAPGYLLGWPILMVSLYSVLTLTCIGLLCREFGLRGDGGFYFAAFFGITPTFFFHSLSYYTHIGELLFFVFSLLLLCRFQSSSQRSLLLAFSGAAGLAFGLRPFSTFLLFLPLFLWAAAQGRKLGFRFVLSALIFPVAGMLLLLSFYNYALVGSFVDYVYLHAGQNADKLSFQYLNAEGVARVVAMLFETGRWLFATGYYPGFSLKFIPDKGLDAGALVLCLSLSMALWKFTRERQTALRRGFWVALAFSVLFLIGGHLFYDYQGGRFGERFFFEVTWLLLLPLFVWLLEKARWLLVVWAGYLIVINGGTLLKFREDNHRRMQPYLQAEAQAGEAALIFIRETPDFDCSFYTLNDPQLRGRIFLCDPSVIEGMSPERAVQIRGELVRLLGRTEAWLYRYDSLAKESAMVRL